MFRTVGDQFTQFILLGSIVVGLSRAHFYDDCDTLNFVLFQQRPIHPHTHWFYIWLIHTAITAVFFAHSVFLVFAVLNWSDLETAKPAQVLQTFEYMQLIAVFDIQRKLTSAEVCLENMRTLLTLLEDNGHFNDVIARQIRRLTLGKAIMSLRTVLYWAKRGHSSEFINTAVWGFTFQLCEVVITGEASLPFRSPLHKWNATEKLWLWTHCPHQSSTFIAKAPISWRWVLNENRLTESPVDADPYICLK
jgi:hypothetical protein